MLASSKADAAASMTPHKLARCLEKTGLRPSVIPAPPRGVPGAELGTIGSVRVDVGRHNGVVAVFFKRAVYLGANKGNPKELKAFRTCLKG